MKKMRAAAKFGTILMTGCFLAVAAGPSYAKSKKPAEQNEAGDTAKGDKGPEAKQPSKFAPPAQFPLKMSWILTTINDKTPPAEGVLMIDENLRGSGRAGCNTWSATLHPVNGQRLAMGPPAMTKKMCSADIMGMERLYMIILRTGPVWDLTGSTLTIKSQYGVMVFNRGL